MFLLACRFAGTTKSVTGAMAAHLPRLSVRAGATPVEAIAPGAALVGPAQVAARIAEFLFLRRSIRWVSARIAVTLHPLGAAALTVAGAPGAALSSRHFTAPGTGLLTIARGTLPLAIFGPEGYGARTGLVGAPARTIQAFAPFVFGLMLDSMGLWAIAETAALCLAALVAFRALRLPLER